MATKKAPAPKTGRITKAKATTTPKKTTAKPTPPKKSGAINRDKKTGRITKGVAQKTNKNGTAGRPTDYNKKYCKALIAHFTGTHYEKTLIKEKIRQTKGGVTTEKEWKLIPNPLPHLEDFAYGIDVTPRTLYAWAHDKDDNGDYIHPEFHDAYERAKQLQKQWLIDNGLAGTYPPASFIFVAKNLTDMRDTKNITLDPTAPEGEVSDDELEEALAD